MYTIILETPEANKFEPWTPTILMEHPHQQTHAKSHEKEKEDGGVWQSVSKHKKYADHDNAEDCYLIKTLGCAEH